MTRQTPTPLTEYSLSDTFRTARELVNFLSEGYMTYDLPYQRGSVWTLDQRIGLVQSWLRGLPIPSIVVNNRGYQKETIYAVIDGKQRLITARMWFHSEFAVPASWFDPEFVESPFLIESSPDAEAYGDTGLYVRYCDLSVVGQRLLAQRAKFPFAEANVGSVREEAALYLLLNGGGTAQTDDDMARAARVAKED